MKRRDLSWTIAFCVSLLIHGMLTDALVENQIADLETRLKQPPFDLRAYLARREEHRSPLELPAEAHPKLIAALPAPQMPKPPEFEELFGERGSKGNALNSTTGEQLMQAREGPQEQAALSRNPGLPVHEIQAGEDGAPRPPAAGEHPPGAAAVGLSALTQPDPTRAPFGIPLAPAPPPLPPLPFQAPAPPIIGLAVSGQRTSSTHTAVALNDSPATKPVDSPPTTKPADVALAAPTTSPVTDLAATQPVTLALKEPRPPTVPAGNAPATQPAIAQTPATLPAERPMLAVASIDGAHLPPSSPAPPPGSGSPSRASGGDPGNKSESESDPFSAAKTIIFRNGKVVARDGRKVKTVRPRLTEAGETALLTMDQPMVEFGVHIDATGRVVSVVTLRSSGSNDVDLPAYRAAWEWEFEPSKDAAGNPTSDAQLIKFVWR